MQKLHLVGFTTDHEGLILSARRGARSGSYLVTIDASLEEAVDQLRARRAESSADADERELGVPRAARVESVLPVREIQARLRQGRSVAEVAKAAGVDAEWIERFAPPVLAERAQVIAKVRAVPLRRARLGASVLPIGEAIRHHLADRGVAQTADEFAESWTARQMAEGRWAVRFTFRYRGRDQVLRFDLDESTGEVSTTDRASGQLGYVAPPVSTPSPARPRPAAPTTARPPEPRPTAKRAVVSTGFRAQPTAKATSRSAKEREKATVAMDRAAARRAVDGERAAARKAKERRDAIARQAREEKAAATQAARDARAAEQAAAAEARAKAAAKADAAKAKAKAAEKASAAKAAEKARVAKVRAAEKAKADKAKAAKAKARAKAKAAADKARSKPARPAAATRGRVAPATAAVKKATAGKTTATTAKTSGTRAKAASAKAVTTKSVTTRTAAGRTAAAKGASAKGASAKGASAKAASAKAASTRSAKVPTATGATRTAATARPARNPSVASAPVARRTSPPGAPRVVTSELADLASPSRPAAPTRAAVGAEALRSAGAPVVRVAGPDAEALRSAGAPVVRVAGPDAEAPRSAGAPVVRVMESPRHGPGGGAPSARPVEPVSSTRSARRPPTDGDGPTEGTGFIGAAANVYGTESARALFRRGLVEQVSEGASPEAPVPAEGASANGVTSPPPRPRPDRPRRTTPLRAT